MKRHAFKMRLKPGCKEEYIRRHNALWPELRSVLKEAGVADYVIYLDEETDTLFAAQKQSGEASSQDLGTNEVVQRWWAYMADLMETHPDHSPVSVPLRECFYLP